MGVRRGSTRDAGGRRASVANLCGQLALLRAHWLWKRLNTTRSILSQGQTVCQFFVRSSGTKAPNQGNSHDNVAVQNDSVMTLTILTPSPRKEKKGREALDIAARRTAEHPREALGSPLELVLVLGRYQFTAG